MINELYRLTIHEAAVLLRRREISSVELTQAVLDRVYAVDDAVKAHSVALPEAALVDAAAAAGADSASTELAMVPSCCCLHSTGDWRRDPGRGRRRPAAPRSCKTSFHPPRRR